MKVLSKNNKVIIADGHAIEWQSGNDIPLKVLTRNNKLLLADGKALRNLKLPAAYQKVAYVQAARNIPAYIDLEIPYDNGGSFEIGITYFGTCLPVGVFYDTKRFRVSLGTNANWFNVGINPNGSIYATYADLTSGNNYTVKGSANGTTVMVAIPEISLSSTYNVDASYTAWNSAESLWLFGVHRTTIGNWGTRTIRYFKYWDKDDNLLRDMMPCYRKSDNVVGMFDLVSQTFFTNAGTGVFTVGEDV